LYKDLKVPLCLKPPWWVLPHTTDKKRIQKIKNSFFITYDIKVEVRGGDQIPEPTIVGHITI
jgi:hypothetical protein